ncbi:MAG: hypothetical protein R3E93_02885 [Thiothrix sp.]
MIVSEKIYLKLGEALFIAQKVEYILYGIASHMGHLEEAKKDWRFAKITAKDFLSDDPEKRSLRTATLGRLYKLFGERLGISSLPFDLFVKERNFFAHEFFRALSRNANEAEYLKRLADFIGLSTLTEKALRGLLSELMEAAAKKEGRESEFKIQPEDKLNRNYYKAFVALHLHEQGQIQLPQLNGLPPPQSKI